MRHFAGTEDAKAVLSVADLVIYGSFLEEQAFPDILIKAMCFGKPIIAPDISMIRKYVCFLMLLFHCVHDNQFLRFYYNQFVRFY